MRYPVTTSLQEIPIAINSYIQSLFVIFSEETLFTKNRKPRQNPTSMIVSDVIQISHNYFRCKVGVSDSELVQSGEVGTFTFMGIMYKASITQKKDDLLYIKTAFDMLLGSGVTLDLLADSPFAKGMEEPITVSENDVFYAIATSNGFIDTWLKKKIKITSESTGGGGVAPTFTNGNPTPVTLGGIAAGSTFSNVPLTTMWNDFLYPYQAPAFSSFYINTQAGTLEVGDTSLANPDFRWSTTNSGNVQANSIALRDQTNSVVLASGLANDGQEVISLPGVTNNTPATQTYRVVGTNTHSTTFIRNYSILWRWRMYYGESANLSLNETDIKGLRASILTNTFARTYSFLAGATYKYITYPTSFGTATSFTDTGSGFAVAMEPPYTVSVTNSFGQTVNFNVHRTTNILNAATNIAVS